MYLSEWTCGKECSWSAQFLCLWHYCGIFSSKILLKGRGKTEEYKVSTD